MIKSFYKYISISLICFLFWKCEDNETMCESSNPDAHLVELRDSEILPAYSQLQALSLEFITSVETYSNSHSIENLELAREALKSTWLEWQNTSSFNFGPADLHSLRAYVNTFPVDSFSVLQNIQNADFSLLANDIKGFPAMDLLLNGLEETDQAILNLYDSNENYEAYLVATASDIYQRVQNVYNEWNDSYGDLFVTNVGFATGSSYSLYINAFIQDWEQIKRDRLALPLGLLTFEIALPELVECHFGKYSKELVLAHIESHERKYLSSEYFGIQELVQEVTEFQGENGETLDEAITTKFSEAKTKLEAIESSLSEAIITNPESVNEAYQTLQSMVILLKTEVTSGLGISVNFSDNDGD